MGSFILYVWDMVICIFHNPAPLSKVTVTPPINKGSKNNIFPQYKISIGNTTVREELMNNTMRIWWKW